MSSTEALSDERAFLELEKGYPHVDSKKPSSAPGIEQALSYTSPPVPSKPVPIFTLGNESLDKISSARPLRAEDRSKADDMDAARQLQSQIFRLHMQYDFVPDSASQDFLDFNSEDFLKRFQQSHAVKERKMQEVAGKLEDLAQKVGKLNSDLVAANSDPLPMKGNESGGGKTLLQSKLSLNWQKTLNRAKDEKKKSAKELNKASSSSSSGLKHAVAENNEEETEDFATSSAFGSTTSLSSGGTVKIQNANQPPVV